MPESSGPVLITGASGFVGSHLVDALCAQGQRTRCLVRATSDLRWIPSADVEMCRGSLDESSGIERALVGATVVFHLGGITSASTPVSYGRTNVEGTRRLVQAMSTHAPEALLVLCSSLAAAGPSSGGRPLRETDPPRPIGPYGESKLTAERLVAFSPLRHVIVRPPTVYGPRDRDVLAMFRWVARGVAPRVGPAEQQLSLVHARDLVDGMLLVAARGAPGGVYYLTDGVVHTWREVVQGIASAVNARPRELPVPSPVARAAGQGARILSRLTRRKPLLSPERVRDMLQPAWTCDDTRARTELGYRSRLSLVEGLRDTACWYRQHGWL